MAPRNRTNGACDDCRQPFRNLHYSDSQLTYLAECPGSTCTNVNANTLKWVGSNRFQCYYLVPSHAISKQFKIDEAGLLSGTVGSGTWGSGKMIDQNSTWTTTIPSTVPSGNYLIRFETIALHSMPAVSGERTLRRS